MALAIFGVLLFLALFAGWVAPYDPIEQYRNRMLVPPVWSTGGSMQHLLGTDEAGRDILSRLIHGARISLFIAFASVLMAVVL